MLQRPASPAVDPHIQPVPPHTRLAPRAAAIPSLRADPGRIPAPGPSRIPRIEGLADLSTQGRHEARATGPWEERPASGRDSLLHDVDPTDVGAASVDARAVRPGPSAGDIANIVTPLLRLLI